MKDKHPGYSSRRKFLATTAVVAAGSSILNASAFGIPSIISSTRQSAGMINGVRIGAITYSFRSMPNQSAEAVLQYVLDAGISAIELMGDPAEEFAGRPKSDYDRRRLFQLRRKNGDDGLTSDEEKELKDLQAQRQSFNVAVASWRATASLEKFEKLKAMYKDAGVSIYAFKPRAFGRENTDMEIDFGLRAAKALGASHVTLEHPEDDVHTKKLGSMGRRHGVNIGYHGHLQQTPTLWNKALDQSASNMLNLDLGHYIAAGNTDYLELVRSKSNRIASMHLKDRQNKINGQKNMPWGEGDTPIVEVLQLMKKKKYKFPGTIELEYDIPEGSDAVQEVSKCLEFCRKALG